ncbi:MAG TPA: THUMP domain-containing protein [Geobacteraceae bacterium]|nr:THUMP domain-containing protein [Geobacteraceae bacterium]
MDFFATTAKGIEDLLADELKALGIEVTAVDRGGVRFSGTMEACYRANLWLRTASRVLIPLAGFPCNSPAALYDGVKSVCWNEFLTPEMTIAVDCSLRDSALTHSGYVALKTKDAIVDTIRDRCGRRPDVETRDPDLRVNVHLVKNHCTVSLDSSGIPLDRRGYRLERNEAPLRETLAAALVILSGWDGSSNLADPMCGSGTIPVEAALKGACRAPGLTRPGFGFQRWPGFEAGLWRMLIAEANGKARDSLPAKLIGCDRSARALSVARQNSERAGVGGMLDLIRGELAEFTPPPGPGVIILNPPYGKRLGEEEELKPLYRQIGDVLKQRCTGYSAYVFTGSSDLAKCIGLRASRRIVLFNGPIECRLLRYDLY